MKTEMNRNSLKWNLLGCVTGALCVVNLPTVCAATLPESLAIEGRLVHTTSASPLPVLLVIADQRDFYYKEYSDTRLALEQAGLRVRVAATTTQRSYAHPDTGQPIGSDGSVVPDLALSQARDSDYSAIVFVGGWGSSMYQYAYNDPNFDGVADNFYVNGPYNGDVNLNDGRISESKIAVNKLIGRFLKNDKPVAGICHGVTVLAWARVDGVSPLKGKRVASPFVGSPACYYRGQWYANFQLGQHAQIVANGGLANLVSGQRGDPTTTADDVVVDGRIITAENDDSSAFFGWVIAREVVAASRTTASTR